MQCLSWQDTWQSPTRLIFDAKRILRYLGGISKLGLIFNAKSGLQQSHGFADADYEGRKMINIRILELKKVRKTRFFQKLMQ